MARSKGTSRSHHDITHLQPLTNVHANYQLPTPYSFRDIARARFYRSRSLRQGQQSNQGQTMTLHTYNPQQCSFQVSTSYTLRFGRYSPDKIFKLKVATARSNQGHTMTLCTYTPNVCPYQVSTFYNLWFLRYSPDKLFSATRQNFYPHIWTSWVKTISEQPLRTVG